MSLERSFKRRNVKKGLGDMQQGRGPAQPQMSYQEFLIMEERAFAKECYLKLVSDDQISIEGIEDYTKKLWAAYIENYDPQAMQEKVIKEEEVRREKAREEAKKKIIET